jgi:hypothetical protein
MTTMTTRRATARRDYCARHARREGGQDGPRRDRQHNTGSYGGVNESTIHVDCVFSDPEIEADGERIELSVS